MWSSEYTFFSSPSEDRAVILANVRCVVDFDGKLFPSDARLVFRPHQFPSAQLELSDGLSDFGVSDFPCERPVSVKFEASALCLDSGILCLNPSWTLGSPYRFRVRQTEPMTLVAPGRILEFESVIYNFGNFSLTGGPSNGRERLLLELPDGWRAEISALPEALRKISVRECLGSPWRVPTNFLRMSRPCGDDVTVEQLDESLFLLRYFISFAAGRHVGFGLGRAFSKNGEVVLARPGVTYVDPMIRPANQHPHWFIPSMAPSLAEVLPGYWRRMTDPIWKDDLDWAIYWWLSATKLGQVSETSILAAQAGLEVLVPAVLARLAGQSKTQIGKHNTAGRIREMIRHFSIPLTIPSELGDLLAFSKSSSPPMDGPDVLSNVRNALAHPEKQGQAGLAYQASLLGMRYLELVVLALFEYRGEAFNRTVFSGPALGLEPVPWV